MKRPLRLLVVLGVLLPFLLLRNEGVRGWLVEGMAYMRDGGAPGVLLFLGLEAVAGLLVMPIWLMSAMAGYVYGFPGGVVLAVPGVVLAGACGFGAGRLLFSRGFRPVFTQGPYWKAVQRAVSREGLKVTTLLRVTPVMPQNFLPYLMASTSLTAGRFALGSLLGLLPVTALQVYVGSLVKDAAALVAGETGVGGPLRWAAPALALVVTVVAGLVLVRVGRRMLRETLAAADAEASDNLSQTTQAP
jgi:uncharacterized membrane protein YdjX (TVP38/TMEM64 family)